MKIRMDFVTNSSSSSFIFTFKNEDNLLEFYDHCWSDNFLSFYNFVKDYIHKPTEEEREELLKKLRLYYEIEKCNREKMIEKYVNRNDYTSFLEYNNALNQCLKREDFQEELEKKIRETDYHKKRDQLINAEYVLDLTVWDTDGGLLQWAIRNGFIEQKMYPYYLYVWYVG